MINENEIVDTRKRQQHEPSENAASLCNPVWHAIAADSVNKASLRAFDGSDLTRNLFVLLSLWFPTHHPQRPECGDGTSIISERQPSAAVLKKLSLQRYRHAKPEHGVQPARIVAVSSLHPLEDRVQVLLSRV